MNYDKLKQVIKAANPKIMELKFGCELEGGFIYSWSNGPLAWIISKNGEGSQIQIPNIQDYKILGRPIRLADVLLALLASNNQIKDEDIDKLIWKMGLGWNLKDDNLDHQSDETKQFLINLLIQPS